MSAPPLAIVAPSGDQATAVALAVCPFVSRSTCTANESLKARARIVSTCAGSRAGNRL